MCFSLKCYDVSELCQFCCSPGVWPAIVSQVTPRGNRERPESGIYIEIFEITQYLMNTLYLLEKITFLSLQGLILKPWIPLLSSLSVFINKHQNVASCWYVTRCRCDRRTYGAEGKEKWVIKKPQPDIVLDNGGFVGGCEPVGALLQTVLWHLHKGFASSFLRAWHL